MLQGAFKHTSLLQCSSQIQGLFWSPILQYNVDSPLSSIYHLRPKYNVPLQVNDHAQGLPLTHLVGQAKRTLGVVPHPEDVI